jgi:hypothetical protein
MEFGDLLSHSCYNRQGRKSKQNLQEVKQAHGPASNQRHHNNTQLSHIYAASRRSGPVLNYIVKGNFSLLPAATESMTYLQAASGLLVASARSTPSFINTTTRSNIMHFPQPFPRVHEVHRPGYGCCFECFAGNFVSVAPHCSCALCLPLLCFALICPALHVATCSRFPLFLINA